MDLVIKRLSSIEEASAGIIEAAENEKKALEQQMRERIQAFDEEAEKATQEKLDQIRSSLNEEMQKKSCRSAESNLRFDSGNRK